MNGLSNCIFAQRCPLTSLVVRHESAFPPPKYKNLSSAGNANLYQLCCDTNYWLIDWFRSCNHFFVWFSSQLRSTAAWWMQSTFTFSTSLTAMLRSCIFKPWVLEFYLRSQTVYYVVQKTTVSWWWVKIRDGEFQYQVSYWASFEVSGTRGGCRYQFYHPIAINSKATMQSGITSGPDSIYWSVKSRFRHWHDSPRPSLSWMLISASWSANIFTMPSLPSSVANMTGVWPLLFWMSGWALRERRNLVRSEQMFEIQVIDWGQWAAWFQSIRIASSKEEVVTLIVGRNCHVKCPLSILWLCEIDEVFHPEVDHFLNLCLIVFMDVLQQAVDLQHLQAVVHLPSGHACDVHRRPEMTRGSKPVGEVPVWKTENC